MSQLNDLFDDLSNRLWQSPQISDEKSPSILYKFPEAKNLNVNNRFSSGIP